MIGRFKKEPRSLASCHTVGRNGRHLRVTPGGGNGNWEASKKCGEPSYQIQREISSPATAGYKAKLEKWDSDSDSDETDEEDLKM